MLVLSRRWGAPACCLLAGSLLTAFTSAPAMAAPGAASRPYGGPATQAVDHSNVGAAHSPELLRQLAGPAGAAAGPSPGQTAPAGIPRGRVTGDQQGVDVASYQHPGGAPINWPRVHASGIGFAGVKATEGAYYRNPHALADLAQARAAGLSVIAYAFAIPNGNGGSSSPVAQADYVLHFLGASSRTVPVMLDIEYNPYGRECYGLTARAMASWVSSFDAEVTARTGRAPIIYTPPGWWAACTGSSTAAGRKTQLWVPDYTSLASPRLPAGWLAWVYWQYSSTGTVRGIPDSGHTDLDQANLAGSARRLAAAAGRG